MKAGKAQGNVAELFTLCYQGPCIASQKQPQSVTVVVYKV